MTAPLIAVEHLGRRYATGRTSVEALRDVSFAIAPGELLAIMGPSGSGKTTLMEILGCLLQPTSGRYRFKGTPVEAITPDGLAALRGREIGFVFQAFNLLPRLTALENVEVPLRYRRVDRATRRARAASAPTVERRPVTVGIVAGDRAQILSGLAEGDEVRLR